MATTRKNVGIESPLAFILIRAKRGILPWPPAFVDRKRTGGDQTSPRLNRSYALDAYLSAPSF